MTEPTTLVAPAVPVVPDPKDPRDDRGGTGGRGPARVIGLALLVALLGFGGGIAGYFVADEHLAEEPTNEPASRATFQPTSEDADVADPKPAKDGSLNAREIYRAVSPAVVHIDARVVRTEAGLFGFGQPEESTGTGSGFVIDDQGHIVTNAHVIEDAEEVTVTFGVDGEKVPAKVVGEDRSSDIAVIKIDPDAKELGGKLTMARFGDSSTLQVGDPVLAIGNPFGLDRTLTTGVVSALQREIPALNDFRIGDVIQTDAAVNPGNSGGPLLDGDGRVVGVNSQIQSRTGGFVGIAFAVPSSRVQEVAKELIEKGEVEYAWLGVAGGELTPELVEEFDLDVEDGVLVGTVTDGSPADEAGLEGTREIRSLGGGDVRREGGDVLLSFDGEQLESMSELSDLVDAREPGDKVRIEYVREGRERSTTVTLGTRPDEVDAENE